MCGGPGGLRQRLAASEDSLAGVSDVSAADGRIPQSSAARRPGLEKRRGAIP